MGLSNVLKLLFTSKIEEAHAENEKTCQRLLDRIRSKELSAALEKTTVHKPIPEAKAAKMSG